LAYFRCFEGARLQAGRQSQTDNPALAAEGTSRTQLHPSLPEHFGMFGDFQLNTGIISPIRIDQAERAVIGQLTSATQWFFP